MRVLKPEIVSVSTPSCCFFRSTCDRFASIRSDSGADCPGRGSST